MPKTVAVQGRRHDRLRRGLGQRQLRRRHHGRGAHDPASADGTIDDAAREFSIEKNPSGPWSYGFAPAGDVAGCRHVHAVPKGETFGGGRQPGAIGSLSNPGSTVWEDVVSDQHPYKRVPHTARIIRELRTVSRRREARCSSRNTASAAASIWPRHDRHFEQLGAEQARRRPVVPPAAGPVHGRLETLEPGRHVRQPGGLLRQCLAKMGGQRLLGLNAIRANPNVVGHSMTGTVDQANCGEGLFTTFRELKPGTVDAMFDGWYPLRWCLFVEPVNVYRRDAGPPGGRAGQRGRAEAGRVSGAAAGGWARRPSASSSRRSRSRSPIPTAKPEPPFALPVFAEDVVIDGPAGKYRFLVTFRAAGRRRPAARRSSTWPIRPKCPTVETEVVLWGEDAELAKWLADAAAFARGPFAPKPPDGARGDSRLRPRRRRRAGRPRSASWPGASPAAPTVVFLSPAVFAKGDNRVRLGAAGEEGRAGGPAVVALSQGRMGQEASDLRRACPPAG